MRAWLWEQSRTARFVLVQGKCKKLLVIWRDLQLLLAPLDLCLQLRPNLSHLNVSRRGGFQFLCMQANSQCRSVAAGTGDGAWGDGEDGERGEEEEEKSIRAVEVQVRKRVDQR
jgi:hypothetical protein